LKLTLDALNSHLQKPLLPIYLVSGDEPLQLMECTDAIRSAARQQGYGTRDIFEVDNEFDWNSLYASSNSLSLFAEKKLIDLRMPSGKPGTSGKKGHLRICR
jgi:DNA polymerase III, delta subunit